MYKIFVDGSEKELEKIRVSAHPFNRVWPGKQRDISQSEEAYMLRLFGAGEKRIEVEAHFPIAEAIVRPLSKGVKIKTEENKVSFTLGGSGKYALEINGIHHAIYLLYQNEHDFSGYPSPTYDFGAGHHYIGLTRLKSGDSVHISRDAVVHGSFLAIDEKDISIYGEGILCGDTENRTEKHGDIGFDNENEFSPEKVHTVGTIRTYRCQNILIEGITVTDPASYAISFFATDSIKIDDVNVLGLWKYNCDGIDFFNCSNIRVKNCFIRSFDDSMCMKALTAFSHINTENAHISDCVFWCDWGKTIDVGLATACKEIKNILWENCDFIHNSESCITISNGQWADIHDVTVRNINVEYSKYTEPCIEQKDDSETYPINPPIKLPCIVKILDYRRNWQGNVSYEDERTKVRDILIENINIFMDAGLDGTPEVRIKKYTEKSVFENIVVRNIFKDGNKLM